jgi:hypothetical protein
VILFGGIRGEGGRPEVGEVVGRPRGATSSRQHYHSTYNHIKHRPPHHDYLEKPNINTSQLTT